MSSGEMDIRGIQIGKPKRVLRSGLRNQNNMCNETKPETPKSEAVRGRLEKEANSPPQAGVRNEARPGSLSSPPAPLLLRAEAGTCVPSPRPGDGSAGAQVPTASLAPGSTRASASRPAQTELCPHPSTTPPGPRVTRQMSPPDKSTGGMRGAPRPDPLAQSRRWLGALLRAPGAVPAGSLGRSLRCRPEQH